MATNGGQLPPQTQETQPGKEHVSPPRTSPAPITSLPTSSMSVHYLVSTGDSREFT